LTVEDATLDDELHLFSHFPHLSFEGKADLYGVESGRVVEKGLHVTFKKKSTSCNK